MRLLDEIRIKEKVGITSHYKTMHNWKGQEYFGVSGRKDKRKW